MIASPMTTVRRSMRLILLSVLCGLVLSLSLSHGAVKSALAEQPAAMYLVPENSIGVAHLLPSRWYQTEAIDMFPTEVATAVSQEFLGLDVMKVDEMLMVVTPPDDEVTGPQFAVALKTTQAVDPGKFFGGLEEDFYFADKDEVKDLFPDLKGKMFEWPEYPFDFIAAHKLDDNTVLFGNAKLVSELAKVKPGRELSAPAKLFVEHRSDSDFTMMLNVPPVREPALAMLQQQEIPPPFNMFAQVPKYTEMAMFELTIGKLITSEIKLLGTDERSAKRLKEIIDFGLQLAQQAAMMSVEQMRKSDDPIEKAVADYAERMTNKTFESLKPTREGNVVGMKIERDPVVMNATVISGLTALTLPAIQAAREAARRVQSINDFKQIGLAVHNYHDTFNRMPTDLGKPDKPLLSWRVHLLPYLEHQALYEQFKLDEPWDSPHNRQFIKQTPEAFRDVRQRLPDGYTTYLAPSGEGMGFQNTGRLSFASFTDGTSNTIMLVQVADEYAVPWTKPADWEVPEKNMTSQLFLSPDGRFSVLFVDAAVRSLSAEINPKDLRNALIRNDGNVVDFGD